MKRVKLYSIAMLLILVVSAVVSPTLARAKAEISKEKATMEIDSLLTLRVSGFEDEVSWESDDETVAAVDDSGTVTAMSEGSATITATVFGNEYTCHVTVVDSNKELVQAGESKSDKGIEYVAYETEQGLVVLLENQNDDEIGQARITIAYYGESGEMLSTDHTFLSEMEPGESEYLTAYAPYDRNWDDIQYDSYEVFINEAYTSDYE